MLSFFVRGIATWRKEAAMNINQRIRVGAEVVAAICALLLTYFQIFAGGSLMPNPVSGQLTLLQSLTGDYFVSVHQWWLYYALLAAILLAILTIVATLLFPSRKLK